MTETTRFYNSAYMSKIFRSFFAIDLKAKYHVVPFMVRP